MSSKGYVVVYQLNTELLCKHKGEEIEEHSKNLRLVKQIVITKEQFHIFLQNNSQVFYET